jgi:hypothetical protein
MPQFIEDLTAAIEACGAEKVGLVMGLALTPWNSAQERDAFLAKATGKEQSGG